MMEIKCFKDGSIIEQGKGKFDDYCVYLTRPRQLRWAPRDKDYFLFFINKMREYSPEKIYQDFVKIYDKTNSNIDEKVLDEIEQICQTYSKGDQLDFCINYTVIYLAMVAEENKKFAVLKKRIKRLGMYQILFEGMKAEEAACFSKGKTVAVLDPMCTERGF